MLDLILGIVAAVGASALYSLGIALQAMDAKEAPHEEHLRPALVLGLLQRARWLLGTGLSMLGWPLQVLALLLAPLVVVQPTLAVGLLVLLFFGERMLGEHAGRYEHLAMLAIVLGMVGTALFAPPRSASPAGKQVTITLVLLGLALPVPAAVPAARLGTFDRRGDDGVRRPRVRLERDRDEAGLRRPLPASSAGRRAVGTVDRRRVGAWACSAR